MLLLLLTTIALDSGPFYRVDVRAVAVQVVDKSVICAELRRRPVEDSE
jgi:hypothetical protein